MSAYYYTLSSTLTAIVVLTMSLAPPFTVQLISESSFLATPASRRTPHRPHVSSPIVTDMARLNSGIRTAYTIGFTDEFNMHKYTPSF